MESEKKERHEEHHEHAHHKHGPGMNWGTVALVLVLVFAASLVATWAGFAVGASSTSQDANSLKESQLVAVDTVALGSTVEDYLNSNLLTDANVNAKIADVNELGNGLYELKYEIYQNGVQVSAGNVYASGKQLVIGTAFDMSKPLPKADTASDEPAVTAKPVKTDRPQVDLYVMSFCPYGNKAEDTFVPDFNLLKNKIDFNVHFIVSVDGNTVQSLHGAPEVAQDMREACVAKYYGNVAWLNFAVNVNDNCGSNGSCWETAAKAFDIDVNKISACVANEGVALMAENAAASNAAGANGSPTLIINGVESSAVYKYGDSEAYKQAICDSFNTAPQECSVVLSSSTSTTQGGSCN